MSICQTAPFIHTIASHKSEIRRHVLGLDTIALSALLYLKHRTLAGAIRRNFVHLDKFSSRNIVSKGLGRILQHSTRSSTPFLLLSDLFPAYDGSSRVVGFVLGMARGVAPEWKRESTSSTFTIDTAVRE
jgi:hypothetical protein